MIWIRVRLTSFGKTRCMEQIRESKQLHVRREYGELRELKIDGGRTYSLSASHENYFHYMNGERYVL